MNHTSTLADHCIHSIHCIHCIHCWVALCLVPCLQEGEGERSIVRGAHQVEAAQMLCIWLQGSANELVLISVFFLSMPLFHFMSKLSYTIIYCNYSLRYDECHSPWCVGRTWGLRWTSSSRNMFAVRTAPGPQREMAGHGGPWRHGNFCWGHLPEIDMYVKKGIIQVEISSELRVGEINDSKW
jgi:hypothetical protein